MTILPKFGSLVFVNYGDAQVIITTKHTTVKRICSTIDISSKCEQLTGMVGLENRKQTDVLGSFAKGLAVIEAFTVERSRMSITDAAIAVGFDRATARRCLLTLHELGFADFDGKYYSLTPRILRLGTSCLAAMPLPRVVQPLLDKLSDEIGQSTSVCVLDDWEIVYVARAAQQRLISINITVGTRLPAYCSSMGRVLLAAQSDDVIRRVLTTQPLQRRTTKCLTDPEKILRQIARAKKDGFAIVDQEIEIGLRSIAVPIIDTHGRVVAALNVGVAAVHTDASELRDIYLEKLLAVQQALKPMLT
jgi:IclR family transcriptional regulator, pca regulon regulatory protein